MRYVLSLALAFFFAGCFHQDPDLITLPSYNPKAMKIHKSLSLQKVFIKSVQDLRGNSIVVGSYELDGGLCPVLTTNDIATWYYDALKLAIASEGMVNVDKAGFDVKNVHVKLLTLNLKYDKNKNLTTKVYVNARYKYNHKEQSENIRLSTKEHFESLPSRSEVEFAIYNVLAQSVDKISLKLANIK